MMKRRLLTALISMMMSMPVLAVDSVWVEGSMNCAEWLDARKVNRAQYYEHFLLGLVNGLALGRGVEIWQANEMKVTREQLYYWIDEFCRKNPLSRPTLGAFAFANERTNGAFDKAYKK